MNKEDGKSNEQRTDYEEGEKKRKKKEGGRWEMRERTRGKGMEQGEGEEGKEEKKHRKTTTNGQ